MNCSNHGSAWRAAPLAPRAGGGKRAMIKISHSTTSDGPDGQPWPPPDSGALWVIVRRADGSTLWRAIELAESELPRTFANPPIGSN